MAREIAQYHVGVKALIRHGDEYLFLHFNSPQGDTYYDWPGGRIDVGEEQTALMEILDREIKEELGINFQYQLGKPAFVTRRYFPQAGLKIFLVIFEAEYIGGDIKLSDEHLHSEWLTAETAQKEMFVNDEDYQAWVEYIQSIQV